MRPPDTYKFLRLVERGMVARPPSYWFLLSLSHTLSHFIHFTSLLTHLLTPPFASLQRLHHSIEHILRKSNQLALLLKVLQWLSSSWPISTGALPLFHLLVIHFSISSSISRASGTGTPLDICSQFPSPSGTTIFLRFHNFGCVFPSTQYLPRFYHLDTTVGFLQHCYEFLRHPVYFLS